MEPCADLPAKVEGSPGLQSRCCCWKTTSCHAAAGTLRVPAWRCHLEEVAVALSTCANVLFNFLLVVEVSLEPGNTQAQHQRQEQRQPKGWGFRGAWSELAGAFLMVVSTGRGVAVWGCVAPLDWGTTKRMERGI